MTLKSFNTTNQFDYVFGDAFNDLSVPYHLTTSEFDNIIKSHLKPTGWYALNVIDEPKVGRFVSSTVKTLQQSFAHVYLLPGRSQWQQSPRSTFVILASDQALDLKHWETSLLPVDTKAFSLPETPGLKQIVPEQELEQYITEKNGIVLTDDYVPVDRMLTPVFSKAF